MTLVAHQGTVVTTGPVGTANPATQTLSTAGYDHNYRTWWVTADANDIADVSLTVNGGVPLQNPTFRLKSMSGAPTSLYPNHFSDMIEVSIDNSSEEYVIDLYNTSGVKIISEKGTVVQINTNEFRPEFI